MNRVFRYTVVVVWLTVAFFLLWLNSPAESDLMFTSKTYHGLFKYATTTTELSDSLTGVPLVLSETRVNELRLGLTFLSTLLVLMVAFPSWGRQQLIRWTRMARGVQ